MWEMKLKEEIIMRINHNIAALNTYRQLNSATGAQGKSMEKLSSGLRINRAGDDAAGLAISEKMRGQIRGLDQASKNAQDGISLIQTAEGALNETHDILQRTRELAVQAANDTATDDDRKEIQKEVNQLIEEIDRIAGNTEFNTQSLLDGTFSNKKVQIGANAGQEMTIGIAAMNSNSMGTAGATTADITVSDFDFSADNAAVTIGSTTINLSKTYTSIEDLASDLTNAFANSEGVTVSGAGGTLTFDSTASFDVDIKDGTTIGGSAGDGAAKLGGVATTNSSGSTTGATINSLKDTSLTGSGGVQTQTDAKAAITAFDNAIKTVSAERSKLGAYQNRLEHSINNLNTSSENLTAAESRIRDVDYALAA